MTERPFDVSTLEAVGELLALGRREGFGITFAPDPDGWAVGYVRGMAGDNLVVGMDLGDTARAAVHPLLDVAAEYAQAHAAPLVAAESGSAAV